MSLLDGFDADKVEILDDFAPLPAGWYLGMIEHGEEKTTKAGTGKYLELKFQVLQEGFKGRLLWDRLNLDNPNQKAVAIARSTLSKICKSVGIAVPEQVERLYNKPLLIKVVQRPKHNSPGEFSNEIKDYKAASAAGELPPPTSASQSAPTKAPWE